MPYQHYKTIWVRDEYGNRHRIEQYINMIDVGPDGPPMRGLRKSLLDGEEIQELSGGRFQIYEVGGMGAILISEDFDPSPEDFDPST